MVAPGERFSRARRLRRSADFQFRPFLRRRVEGFLFLFGRPGEGRLGVSLPKKVLRRAVARNRVRRLLREAFRRQHQSFAQVDIHVIGERGLTDRWRSLTQADVVRCFEGLATEIDSSRQKES